MRQRSKVISGAPVRYDELAEMTVRDERSNVHPDCLIFEKITLYLISRSRVAASDLSRRSTLLHILEAGRVEDGSPSNGRALRASMLADGYSRGGSLLVNLVKNTNIL